MAPRHQIRGPETCGSAILFHLHEHEPSACNPYEEDYRVHIRGKLIWLARWRNSRGARLDRYIRDIVPRVRLPLRIAGGQLSDGTTSVLWIIHQARTGICEFEVIFMDGFQSHQRGTFADWRKMVDQEFTEYLNARAQARRQAAVRERRMLSV